jgi:hypothetical protein
MTTLILTRIDENYLTDYSPVMCCDNQYRYYCDSHFEPMGCMFCEFDPYEPCDEQH